ncbi:YicC family protein [Apibacter raozihei]|uniref:YicC/YloC family endoribonuclease n=1 Tax=Apibacter raozihei TaxID=2500547 RepID=UPI000FE35A83|nr:YicC/YloC family endoribonuclease [Apibacter raozihei]
MLQSMTGYGKSEVNTECLKISIEIKTLNSKSLDLFVRISPRYRNKELELRKIIGDQLLRGKVDFSIAIENLSADNNSRINLNTVQGYIANLEELNIEGSKLDFLKMAVRMPEVFTNQEVEISDAEWKLVIDCLTSTLQKVNEFRQEEGGSLEKVLQEYAHNILNLLTEIEKYETERIDGIRSKLQKQLLDLQVQFDEQRFHQELIYYIEKLDINEEKVRLKQHCKYFFEVMDTDFQAGKKLGFISQEMGREINTIGSKANHPEIQKLVVLMKDELEKIKEQINNVL